MYLGTNISSTVDPRDEIQRRISITMPILKKLELFWKEAECSTKWKIQVYNAVVTAKLLYSLETLMPTKQTAEKLNVFQLKGLRKILKMHTTFIDRENTNEEVYRRANEAMGRNTEGKDKVIPLTEVLAKRRLKLLGHIIRRERSHPQQQTTFATADLVTRQTSYRRVGRPRLKWAEETMKEAWQIIRETRQDLPPAFNENEAEHRNIIKNAAEQREKPFD